MDSQGLAFAPSNEDAPSTPDALDPRSIEPSRRRAPYKKDAAALEARTTFERFELKYWITEPLADRIVKFAEPYVKRDPHSATKEAQRNTSLYLDTRGFRFCEDHVALSPDRIKLRIRVYGFPLGKTAFFEVKRKMKTITVKNRFVLPVSEVSKVLGYQRAVYLLPTDERKTFDDFLFRMRVHRAEPKVYIGCYRDAFESLIPGEDVRLTIDRELVYQPATGVDFAPDDRRWVNIREEGDSLPSYGRRPAMLELKFDGSCPRWMVELVRHFNLQRVAFSKYTTAAQQLRGRL